MLNFVSHVEVELISCSAHKKIRMLQRNNYVFYLYTWICYILKKETSTLTHYITLASELTLNKTFS